MRIWLPVFVCLWFIAAADARFPRPGVELFVDELNVAASKNVHRTLHAASKPDQPVIRPDQPWEKGNTYLYGTVLRDEKTGKFRMWYSGGGMAYAESDDGIHWIKPQLSYFQIDGKPTNLLMRGKNVCFILHDPADPDPARRYKGMDNTDRAGFIGFYSADGLVWHDYPQKPLISFGSEIANAIRDPHTGRYLLYVRPFGPKQLPKTVEQKRLVAVSTSANFTDWSEPRLIITPDAADDSWVAAPEQRTEFYGMAGFPYGNHYLGLLPVFQIQRMLQKKDLAVRQSSFDGPIEAQLVTSRDGLTWQRTAERKPVIPRGPHPHDAGCIMNVASVPVIVGDEIWHYYTALSTKHGGKAPEKQATIALARWRLDGFVSLDAGAEEGVVQTQPITGKTGRLEVNVDASGGRLVVEVLDENGAVIPGYSAGDCRPVAGDAVHQLIEWSGKKELPAAGSFCLRFKFTGASLYSYSFVAPR